jgi:hypothetical protein
MLVEPPRSADSPKPRAGPLQTAAVVVYGTLLLLALTIPHSVVDWIRDVKSLEIQEALLPAAEALQRFAQGTGVATPFSRARKLFLALSSNESDN